MFTTGSKLLIGSSLLAAVAAASYGVTQDGVLGTMGLVSAAVALAFLAGINVFVRDANVSAMDTEAFSASAAAQPAPSPSMWPAVGALGAGVAAVGLVTVQAVFVLGLVVVIASAVEWMVEAWSERASADAGYNREVRGRVAHGLEFPVAAAVGLGAIVYLFSRIMLNLSKESGPAAFGVLAALLLAIGFIIAYRPSLRGGAIATLCTLAALALGAGGIAAAIGGERELEEHSTTGTLADAQACDSSEETEADEHASRAIAAKSNPAATITLTESGELELQMVGFPGATEATLTRSSPSNVIFRNESAEEHRLVLDLGERPQIDPVTGAAIPDTSRPYQLCTQLVGEDGAQFLSVTVDKPSAAAGPYRFFVPGVEGAEVAVVVP
jgi:hypothetical protein